MFPPDIQIPDSADLKDFQLSSVPLALKEFGHPGIGPGAQWDMAVTYKYGFKSLSLGKATLSLGFFSDLWDHHVEECYAKDMLTTANACTFALLKNTI